MLLRNGFYTGGGIKVTLEGESAIVHNVSTPDGVSSYRAHVKHGRVITPFQTNDGRRLPRWLVRAVRPLLKKAKVEV